MPLEDFADPTFDAPFEPAELRRRQCENCSNTLADWACSKCSRLYCQQCELDVHHEIQNAGARRDAHEESKGDGRPHLEYLTPVNVCEECGRKGADFLCVSCRTYQCAACSTEKHLRTPNNGSHMYFSIEGSSPTLICYSQWAPAMLEMAKTVYRNSHAVLIKSEKGLHATSSFSESIFRELSGLSIDNSQRKAPTPAAPSSPQQAPVSTQTPASSQAAPAAPRSSAAFVVDLTESDDEQAADTSAASYGASVRVKAEPRVKTESAWLSAAATAPVNTEVELDTLLGQILEDDDFILRTMIADYNALSGRIYNTEREIAQLREKARGVANMQEIVAHRQAVQALVARLSRENQDRINAVAKIVLCIKSDPAELKALMNECTMNIPGAQLDCHRQCAVLEASIREKLTNLKRLRDGVTSAVSMKKQAFDEVKRLGDMIAREEAATRKLHQDRIEEFLRLCSFSQQIQTAVHKMVGTLP